MRRGLAILGAAALLLAAAPPASAQSWESGSIQDEITDEVTHFASVAASSHSIPAWRGDTPQLFARCDAGRRLNVLIVWHEYLSNEPVKVAVRFDKTPAKQANWGIGTEGITTFAPERNALSLVGDIENHETMFARVWDYQGTAHNAKFNLSGSKAALAKVRSGCSRIFEEAEQQTTQKVEQQVKWAELARKIAEAEEEREDGREWRIREFCLENVEDNTVATFVECQQGMREAIHKFCKQDSALTQAYVVCGRSPPE